MFKVWLENSSDYVIVPEHLLDVFKDSNSGSLIRTEPLYEEVSSPIDKTGFQKEEVDSTKEQVSSSSNKESKMVSSCPLGFLKESRIKTATGRTRDEKSSSRFNGIKKKRGGTKTEKKTLVNSLLEDLDSKEEGIIRFFSDEEEGVLLGSSMFNSSAGWMPDMSDMESIINNEMITNRAVDAFIKCLIYISDYRKHKREREGLRKSALSRTHQLQCNKFCFIGSTESTIVVGATCGYEYIGTQEDRNGTHSENASSKQYELLERDSIIFDNTRNLKKLTAEYAEICQFDTSANWKDEKWERYTESKRGEPSSEYSKRLLVNEYLALAGSVIIMPRLFATHWTLSVYDPVSQKHIFYDSLSTNSHQALWRKVFVTHYRDALRNGIERIGSQKKALEIRFVNAVHPAHLGGIVQSEILNTFNRPASSLYTHQTDGVNCGVFVCYYAWKIITGSEFDPEREGWFGRDHQCNSQFMFKVFRPSMYRLFKDLANRFQREKNKASQPKSRYN